MSQKEICITRGERFTFLRILPLVGLVSCLLAAFWGWRTGLFTSQEVLQRYVLQSGAAGAVIFILLQIVQVVVPIIPGGLGCLAGVLLFGPFKGFVYNYIGICIGSFLVFAISKNCGPPLLSKLFPAALLAKYSRFTAERDRFAKWFAAAIFLPVAPDDFLCYLAGTTAMPWRQYVPIILLGKPLSIAAYSMGLTLVFQQLSALL